MKSTSNETISLQASTTNIMKFTAVILSLWAMCASAFIAPSAVVKSRAFVAPTGRSSITVAPKTTMNMGFEQIVDILPAVPTEVHHQVLDIANNPLLLALNGNSFGGLTGPIAGCSAVALLIVVLAPPRVD